MFKKFKLLTSIILAFAMMLSAVACQPASDESEKKTGSATSFVSLDVNPEIELTLDENDVVLSVHGANEDARVLLLGEVDLKGKTLDEAVVIITELAVELGYLSEDNKYPVAFTISGSVEICLPSNLLIKRKLLFGLLSLFPMQNNCSGLKPNLFSVICNLILLHLYQRLQI